MNVATDQEMTKFGTPLTITALIEQAQNRLSQGWTTGEAARNSRGKRVDAYDKKAVCWCLVGSINRAYYDLTGMRPSYTGQYRLLWLRIEDALWRRRGDKDLIAANDHANSVSLPFTLLKEARHSVLATIEYHPTL